MQRMEKKNLSRTTPAFLLAASVFLAAGAAHALQITSLTPQGEVARIRQVVAKFDQQLDDAKSALGDTVAAANPVNVLAYNSPEESRIFTAESAQGILLERLGFSLAELPSDLTAADKGIMAGRKDVVPVGQENLPRAVPGNTTFIVIGDAADAERFLADPTLQQTPSVEKKQVIGLGKDSFRLDYYSASNLIDRVTSAVR